VRGLRGDDYRERGESRFHSRKLFIRERHDGRRRTYLDRINSVQELSANVDQLLKLPLQHLHSLPLVILSKLRRFFLQATDSFSFRLSCLPHFIIPQLPPLVVQRNQRRLAREVLVGVIQRRLSSGVSREDRGAKWYH